MGVLSPGTVFDLSGSSKYLGAIPPSSVTDSFVSGSYFENFAIYGGTKSSGTSTNYTIRKDLEGAIAALR